jgi:hypothetical protein
VNWYWSSVQTARHGLRGGLLQVRYGTFFAF